MGASVLINESWYYVRAILLLRDEGLFLNVTPIRRKKRLIIEVSALTPRSDKRRSQSA